MQAGCNSEWGCVEVSTPHKQPRDSIHPTPRRLGLLRAACLPSAFRVPGGMACRAPRWSAGPLA